MATEFTVDIKSSGGDYSSLNSAYAALANNLTVSTIKVFSVSVVLSPTIAAGDAVNGNTSGATGTCVLVNVAKTQILIKSISGTFSSGEVVQKTGDATKTVTLSNAGDSPILGFRCFAFQDTTAATLSGFTTDATHYTRVYAAPGAEAQMPYNTTTSYRLEVANNTVVLVNDQFVRLERLQFKYTSPGFSNTHPVIQNQTSSSVNPLRIIGCHLKVATNASNGGTVGGIAHLNVAGYTICVNTVIQGADAVGNTNNYGVTVSSVSNIFVGYNLLVYNCANGYVQAGTNTVTLKNCMYNRGASSSHTGYSGTITGNNNASTEADASGTSNRNSQTFTYVNSGTGDYHLATTDAGAKGFGANLSADATYPFSTDFGGFNRIVPWDIGPTLVRTMGPIKISKSRMDLQGIPIRAASTILSTTPSAGTVAGITFTLVSNETQAVGDVVMVNASGKAAIANATAIATAAGIFIAATAVTGSASNTYLVHGVVKFSSSQGWTAGETIYLSTTGTTTNTLTNTAPSGTDNVIQILGVALANDTLNFHPELLMIEHL